MGSGTMFGEHTIHFLQSNLMHRPIETVNGQMLRSVKTGLQNNRLADILWCLCKLCTLSDIPGTHTVRGTRRYSRYGRRLRPLHKKYAKRGQIA